jgi:hypothetical protein
VHLKVSSASFQTLFLLATLPPANIIASLTAPSKTCNFLSDLIAHFFFLILVMLCYRSYADTFRDPSVFNVAKWTVRASFIKAMFQTKD